MTSNPTRAARDIGMIAAVSAAISIPLILTTPIVGDERYHFPLAVRFASGFPVFDPAYSSAYPPLPYVIVGAIMRLTGPAIEVARMVNLVIGILGAWGFYRLVRMLRPGAERAALAFIAFAPYYLRDCSAFYMGNWAVAAAVWALFFFLRREKPLDIVYAGLLLGAGTLCGQWLLPGVAAVMVADLGVALSPSWKTNPAAIKAALVRMAVIVVCQVPTIGVFAGWGAMAPPMFAESYRLRLAPRHLVGVLAVLGFTFFWWVIRRLRRVPPLVLATLGISLPLICLALPDVSQNQGLDQFTGLSTRLLQVAGAPLSGTTAWLLIPMAFLALVLTWLTLRTNTLPGTTIRLMTLALLAAFAGSSIVGETHLRLLPPLLFLAVVCTDRIDATTWLVVVQNSALGIAYALYHAIFKFG